MTEKAKNTQKLKNFATKSSEGEVIITPTRGLGKVIFTIPGPDKPLIVKLLKNPFTGDADTPVQYFKHRTGQSPKAIGSHASRRSLGLGEAPEWEHFGKIKEQLQELSSKAKLEYGEGYMDYLNSNQQYIALREEKKFFRPRFMNYLFVVFPDDPQIRPLKATQTLYEAIFGAKAWGDRAAKVGVTEVMNNKNLIAYVDEDAALNERGWVEIWKTGEGLDTKYHAKLSETETQEVGDDGEPFTKKVVKRFKLAEEIQKAASTGDLSELPEIIDPIAMEIENSWTEEECINLCKARGSITGTPDRFLSRDEDDSAAERQASGESDEDSATEPAAIAAATEDIPF